MGVLHIGVQYSDTQNVHSKTTLNKKGSQTWHTIANDFFNKTESRTFFIAFYVVLHFFFSFKPYVLCSQISLPHLCSTKFLDLKCFEDFLAFRLLLCSKTIAYLFLPSMANSP